MMKCADCKYFRWEMDSKEKGHCINLQSPYMMGRILRLDQHCKNFEVKVTACKACMFFHEDTGKCCNWDSTKAADDVDPNEVCGRFYRQPMLDCLSVWVEERQDYFDGEATGCMCYTFRNEFIAEREFTMVCEKRGLGNSCYEISEVDWEDNNLQEE